MNTPLKRQTAPRAVLAWVGVLLCHCILWGLPAVAKPSLSSSHAGEDGPEAVLIQKQVSETMDIEQKIQKKASAWSQEKSKLMALSAELKPRRNALAKRLEKTRRLLALETEKNNEYLRKQEEARRIKKELSSYLESVVDALEKHIQGDMPFLMEERNARILSLKELLVDPSDRLRKSSDGCLSHFRSRRSTAALWRSSKRRSTCKGNRPLWISFAWAGSPCSLSPLTKTNAAILTVWRKNGHFFPDK